MASPRFQAWKDLCKRYLAVWQVSWQARRQLDPKPLLSHEAQFLPAALALQESPPSPVPRITAWLLMAFFLIAVLWACFGKIDIVAVAQGKIIPNDRIKTIQPIETAMVKRIAVSEGQFVKAGELLIELDATENRAENQKTHQSWQYSRLEALRAQALLSALDRRGGPTLAPQADIEAASFNEAQQLANSQWQEYQAKLAAIDAELVKREAEQETSRELVAKLEQTLPIARQRAEDYKNLLNQNFVSKHGYLEQEQQRIERERDFASGKSKIRELQAAIAEGRSQRVSLAAEFRRSLYDQLNAASQKADALEQELVKTDKREQLMRLVAPVSGTVQQLAVHTVGGVVTPAQALMTIVPKDNPLEVEAWVDNKDIGFVNAKQSATVKIETFPYTKYGTINGQVLSVSDDAISDEKRGLIYHSRVLLDKTQILVGDKKINLTPGMAVTVEVKTGQRRVIEYFLSPLMEYGNESLRER